MKPLGEVLKLYVANPKLVGAFGEVFGKGLTATDKFQHDPTKAFFMYHVITGLKNVQDSCHGGALAALVDVSTTINILRMTPNRTISISLNTQFLNAVKLEEDIGVETQITKIGKNIVYTDCRIFIDVRNLGKQRLACRGSHIKAILPEKWDFMM